MSCPTVSQDLNRNNNATARTNRALNADQPRRDCRKKSTRKSMAHLAGAMTPSTLDSGRTGLRRTLSRSSASERWVSEMGIESFLCCGFSYTMVKNNAHLASKFCKFTEKSFLVAPHGFKNCEVTSVEGCEKGFREISLLAASCHAILYHATPEKHPVKHHQKL